MQIIKFAAVCASLWIAGAHFSTVAAEQSAKKSIHAEQSLLLDAAIAARRIICVGERGHILLSDDQGRSWRQADVPTQATLTAVYFLNESLGWAVGHDAVILATVDGGEHWQRQYEAPQLEQPLLDVWFKDAHHGFAVGAYGSFYATTDGGKTWLPKKISADDRHFNAIAGTRDGKLFIAGESGGLYRSDDGGGTWATLKSPYAGSYFGLLALPDRALLVFGLRGKIFRSNDLGRHWAPIITDNQASLMGGAVLANGEVALVGLDGAVLISEDEGRSFTHYKNPDGKALAAVAQAETRELLLFGEAGIVRTAINKLRRDP